MIPLLAQHPHIIPDPVSPIDLGSVTVKVLAAFGVIFLLWGGVLIGFTLMRLLYKFLSRAGALEWMPTKGHRVVRRVLFMRRGGLGD